MPADPRQRADSVLRRVLAEADRAITLTTPAGRAATRRMIDDLEAADRLLGNRLLAEARRQGGSLGVRFTGAQALAYQRQIRLAIGYAQGRLLGLTNEQAQAAVALSMQDSISLLEGLERAYTGVATPLRMREAQNMDAISRGAGASLLRRNAASVDRYGTMMISEFERDIRVGMLAGLSQYEMIASLTGRRGPSGPDVSLRAVVVGGQVRRVLTENIPEGLFVRYRYFAERIVRTEVANAYNDARLGALFSARANDFPDMGKKILAHFDQRTAWDSVAVHGQVRRLEEYFQDGAGRVYLRPPGRPNDRETVIPWREHWRESHLTRMLTAEELQRQQARIAAGRGTSYPRKGPQPTPGTVLRGKQRPHIPRPPPVRPPPAPLPPRVPLPVQPPLPFPPTRAPRAVPVPIVPPAAPPVVVRPVVPVAAPPAPPPAPAPAPARPPREAMLDAIEAAGRPSRNRQLAGARGAVRAWVESSLPGVRSRDGGRPRGNVLSVRRLGRNVNGQHEIVGGGVDIAARIATEARYGAMALKKGYGAGYNNLGAIRTYVHEEIHGCSPGGLFSYRGPGVVVEEVCTELLARRSVRQLAPGEEFRGSYQHYIDGMLGATRAVRPGATIADLESAALRMWSTTETHDTPEALCGALMDALGITDREERAGWLQQVRGLAR